MSDTSKRWSRKHQNGYVQGFDRAAALTPTLHGDTVADMKPSVATKNIADIGLRKGDYDGLH